jgi:RNA polymerase sigma factor (sigma-70 family)
VEDRLSAASTRYSLLLRIQDPTNERAWGEFVSLYEPLIYGLARRQGLQDADARDLCQDVFRAVAKAAGSFTPNPAQGSFRTWLFRIARNLMLNLLRQQRRHPRGSGDSDIQRLLEAHTDGADEQSQMLERDYRRRLFRFAAESIRGQFAPATWEAFWLAAVENRSASDAAAQAGISVGAVYIAKSRVLARLRERVLEIEGEQ